MSLKLKIIRPGLFSTIQDHGRGSYRDWGIPSSGPMDPELARLANQLLGNPDKHPVLEFTLWGPVIELQGNGYISLAGGQLKAKLDHEPVPTGQVIPVSGAQTLSIGKLSQGCRGYLAVAGDWKLPHWLGSCSTAAQKPHQLTPGSLIKKGLVIRVDQREPKFPESSLLGGLIEPTRPIRILAGPEYDLFSTENIRQLLGGTFSISSESNRMGYRLAEPLEDYKVSIEIISSAVVPGTIQVTHSGQLIILMNDAQTTGGYPRIANVISADLGLLGQKRPGDAIGFKLVSLEEAHAAIGK